MCFFRVLLVAILFEFPPIFLTCMTCMYNAGILRINSELVKNKSRRRLPNNSQVALVQCHEDPLFRVSMGKPTNRGKREEPNFLRLMQISWYSFTLFLIGSARRSTRGLTDHAPRRSPGRAFRRRRTPRAFAFEPPCLGESPPYSRDSLELKRFKHRLK